MSSNDNNIPIKNEKKIKCNSFFIYTGILLLIILVASFFLSTNENYNNSKKWSCSENGCELSINGKYNTKEECQKKGCALHKKVTFSDNVQKIYY
jgi:hypothetical protein